MKWTSNKGWLEVVLKSFIALISMCFIVSLPKLIVFNQTVGFHLQYYLQSVMKTFLAFLEIIDIKTFSINLLSVWPRFFESYTYSMTILHISVFITIIVSLFISFIYFVLSARFKKIVANLLMLTEAIPDLFIITTFQYVIIFIYKWTEIKLFQIYGFQSNVYFLPIICLSLVPMFLLSRMVITLVEEESDKDYILFGKAKGLSRLELFSRHVFRNLMKAMVRYFNVIYWSMLSSLFIIEYLFEMGGFTEILYRTNEAEFIMFALLLLLLPYGVIQLIFKFMEKLLLGGLTDAKS